MHFSYKHKTKPGKHAHITKEFLQAERDAGKTVKQIAEDTGIAQGSISSLFIKHGLTIKRK